MELVVALDQDTVAWPLLWEAGVRWFKLSASNLLRDPLLLDDLREISANLVLDLKVYDIPDSVRRIVWDGFQAGATFITVHPACTEAALQAKRGPHQHVLPVAMLTAGMYHSDILWTRDRVTKAGAAVCPAQYIQDLPGASIYMCPGIRLPDGVGLDQHREPVSPAQARAAGATHLVVGRPITWAGDPAAVVRQILEECR